MVEDVEFVNIGHGKGYTRRKGKGKKEGEGRKSWNGTWKEREGMEIMIEKLERGKLGNHGRETGKDGR